MLHRCGGTKGGDCERKIYGNLQRRKSLSDVNIRVNNEADVQFGKMNQNRSENKSCFEKN